MSDIVIASQWNDVLTNALARRLPEAEIAQAPLGAPASLPPNAAILAAAPFKWAGENSIDPPSGWPFGLKWIQLLSVGLDSYPNWIFDGPTVTSAYGTSSVALAEFALASILSAAKKIPAIWIHDSSDWKPHHMDIVQGSTLGIVGFGAIAKALAPRAIAMGMKVAAIRRSKAPIDMSGVEQMDDLNELFSCADHVVLAAPITKETHHIVSRKVLEHAKPGQHLINISRGSLINNDDLLWALDEGRLALASLDVTEPEPLPSNHQFYTHPKIRLSPHTSAYTPDTVDNLIEQFAENYFRFLKNERLKNVVDISKGY